MRLENIETGQILEMKFCLKQGESEGYEMRLKLTSKSGYMDVFSVVELHSEELEEMYLFYNYPDPTIWKDL